MSNKDIDTNNTIVVDGWSNIGGYYGRKNIVINVGVEEFENNPMKVLEDNLSNILSMHKRNVLEMEYLMEYQKGKQDILEKTRANNSETINNKHITNYAWEFVNFKKGYYVGKPIKYVDLQVDTQDSEIKYLNRYLKDVKKASKDLIKYENMLITGIAHTMTIPKRVDIDNEYESPFEYTVLDNKYVFVVKSNDIYKSRLFALYISHIKEDNNNEYDLYTIYYKNKCLQVRKSALKGLELVRETTMPISECITEYQLNEQRMGVFEPVLVSLNSLNGITSHQLDQLEENVNSYLTFENVDIDEITENIQDFRDKRILVVNTNNPEAPAKIGKIVIDTEQTPINQKYDKIEQRTYDIVGVPMPTSSTGQGVSGEAQQYGGGWENAQNIALVDTLYIKQFEEEDLGKFIRICKEQVDSKIKKLYPTEIEIKYTINKSNNMQVKAQSMTYYIDKGFTREQALRICEITDDPQTEGKIADDNYAIQKQKEIEYELEKAKKTQELNSKQEDNSNKNVKE